MASMPEMEITIRVRYEIAYPLTWRERWVSLRPWRKVRWQEVGEAEVMGALERMAAKVPLPST